MNLNSSHATFRVYIEDTDAMGVVYHANYLRFFERARSDMFRQAGLPLTALITSDYHFAIRDIKLHYDYPARLDDVLSISTVIAEQRSCSLLFEQKMKNQDNKMLCQASINVVCVNKAMKPKRLPNNFLANAL
ncbi:acyl-CoA thioesterase [Legionella beliardensis]|uniref:Acyl-CoA thioesterase n=1 Tax=Legionella beliardensis TaxID=91822 RepID=A0A378I2H9_9GAMM|nr:tol-pal system-associated acyl-CoA thioesterase [Legionella beliardensis]STX29152.1 acyl-CoA thioesterase [Legionella beliardensis]